MLDTLIAYQDAFFYIPFGTDALLCAIQWPMFAWNGPDWLLKTLAGDKAHSSPGYAQLYDLFMLCYTGYCAMFFFSLHSILRHPDLLPTMACIQVGIILMKMVFMMRWSGRGNEVASELKTKKDASLYTFYLPMYTCYFALKYFF